MLVWITLALPPASQSEPSLQKMATARECTAAGGKHFSMCPENGQSYCCGVCHGTHKCGQLESCACDLPETPIQTALYDGVQCASAIGLAQLYHDYAEHRDSGAAFEIQIGVSTHPRPRHSLFISSLLGSMCSGRLGAAPNRTVVISVNRHVSKEDTARLHLLWSKLGAQLCPHVSIRVRAAIQRSTLEPSFSGTEGRKSGAMGLNALTVLTAVPTAGPVLFLEDDVMLARDFYIRVHTLARRIGGAAQGRGWVLTLYVPGNRGNVWWWGSEGLIVPGVFVVGKRALQYGFYGSQAVLFSGPRVREQFLQYYKHRCYPGDNCVFTDIVLKDFALEETKKDNGILMLAPQHSLVQHVATITDSSLGPKTREHHASNYIENLPPC